MPEIPSDLIYHNKTNLYNLKMKQSKVFIVHLCLLFQTWKFNSHQNILKRPATAYV